VLEGVRAALASKRPLAVVSPIISGEAVKGPAAKLFLELAKEPASSLAVARHYQGLATHFILDERDAALEPEIRVLGYETSVQQTLMSTPDDKTDLARAVCAFLDIA
jgi:LPPG:FO 2-phospho-L-lactate transferase